MTSAEGGFIGAKLLADDSYAGIINLAFTHAICMGVSKNGDYSRRYCYSTMLACVTAYMNLESLESEPTGWLARRPQYLEAQFNSMHSAPRDGTTIRVAGFMHGYCEWVALVRYHEDVWVVVRALGGVQHLGDDTTCKPTHWQPEENW
jgi:hypothetical protein